MRRVSWDTYKRQRETFARVRADARPQAHARRRPRDPEERRILARLDEAAWRRWLESGKVEILGPRHWRLHLG